MATKAASKTTTKKSTAKKTAEVKTEKVSSKKTTALTEEKVKGMIEDAISPFKSGLDSILEMLKEQKKTVTVEEDYPVPEEESEVEIPEPPLHEPPEIPDEEPAEEKKPSEPLEEKETVEVSSRTLSGVILEQGVPWNMFLVGMLMSAVITAIFTAMYFLHQSLKLSPLEIKVPTELEYNEVSRIDTGIEGKAVVYTIGEEDQPLVWNFNDGLLYVKPQREGSYSLLITIASGRQVYSGCIKFESCVGAGDNRYARLTQDIITAIEDTIPEKERSFCKEIGENYKEVAQAKPETLNSFGEMVRDKNRTTLGFDSLEAKLEDESNWFNLLKNGGPVSDLILQYAGTNPSKETLSRIALAISKGFSAIKY